MSTCMGAVFRFGVRSTHPASFGPAEALWWMSTSVMVMKMWLNGPCGAPHVAGSLTCTLTAVAVMELDCVPLPQPAGRIAMAKAARMMREMQKVRRMGELLHATPPIDWKEGL